MKGIYLLFCLIIFSTITFGQTGKITGKVISINSGGPLGGASLILVEKSTSRAADQNGGFSFIKLQPGTYSIKCTYAGFQDKIIEDIIVKENENTDVSISLEPKLSDEVVVTSSKKIKAAGETVASLLIVQKNSANVSDGITAETIKRTPDKSSSDVIKRVSGASIQDDKFAIIRGLNDRYNASFINGAPLPSTESDRKAFAYDIFPSAILDNLIIFKTSTPDKTAEFGGGIIEITTKSTSSNNVGVFSIGLGYNSLVTGNTRLFSEIQGKKDWLGIDDGTRALPKGIPPDKNGFLKLTPDEALDLAKNFDNYKWGVKSINTSPNSNFQLAKSFNINKNDKEFIASIFSLTYNRNFTFSTGENNSYDNPNYGGDPSVPTYFPQQRRKVIDSIYNEEIIWAVLGNFSVIINNQNNISWKNNYSVNSDNRLIRRFGQNDVTDEPNTILKTTVSQFISDMIFSSQLNGDHQIGKYKTKLNWLASYSKVNREMPNQLLSVPGSLSAAGSAGRGASGGMVSTNNQESIKNAKADITQRYSFANSNQNFVKIGAGYQLRERDFGTRDLNFITYSGPTYETDFSVYKLPDEQRFLRQYLGLMENGKAGVSVQDGSVPNSAYVASSTNTHAYIMDDQRIFEKFRLIAGVRMEIFNQKLVADQRGLGAINLNYTKTDFLPSANLVYALTPKTNLRLSYSETLNRPEFRELASFGFLEIVSGLFVSGDSTLTRARIKNLDFRYEYYPGKAQLLSFSAFYKKFTNPIEFVISDFYPGEATYANKPSATLYGVEAEFRILLSSIFNNVNENSLLNKFTLAGNGAFIKSKVPLGKAKDSSEVSRPLQGQSPYLFNFSLAYSDENTGLSSTLSVNRIGERLVLGGSIVAPDVYDSERTVLDFQLAKSFLDKKIEVKFNIRDLLAQNITTYFDYDKSKSFTEKDRIFYNYKTPKSFTFSASFKF